MLVGLFIIFGRGTSKFALEVVPIFGEAYIFVCFVQNRHQTLVLSSTLVTVKDSSLKKIDRIPFVTAKGQFKDQAKESISELIKTLVR